MSEAWTWRVVDDATGEVVAFGTEPIVMQAATETEPTDAP